MIKKAKKPNTDAKNDERQSKAVIMACCPGDEGKAISGDLKDEVCIRLGKDLGERGNVVMTRLDDVDLKQIDALVEVEAFKSRSEAAAFFIKQGIQARTDLFEKIMPAVEKIRELKGQAQKELGKKEKHDMGVKK